MLKRLRYLAKMLLNGWESTERICFIWKFIDNIYYSIYCLHYFVGFLLSFLVTFPLFPSKRILKGKYKRTEEKRNSQTDIMCVLYWNRLNILQFLIVWESKQKQNRKYSCANIFKIFETITKGMVWPLCIFDLKFATSIDL